MDNEKQSNAIKNIITADKIQEILDWGYNAALNGLPGEKTCEELAKEYLSKQHSKDQLTNRRKAASQFAGWQIAKCTTTGFLLGIPGGPAMIATIPTDLASTIYVQLRMIATIAVIGGYDVNEDVVRSMVYCCMGGLSVSKALKEAGIVIGGKAALAGIKKIPGKALIAVNKKVGFRLLTKFGQKGVINLGKLVPVVGGVLGGGFNLAETAGLAKIARRQFIENIFDEGDGNFDDNAENEVVVDV